MSDAEHIVTLRGDDVVVTLYPHSGGRIGQIAVAGQPLLVDVPPPEQRHPMMWGSFAMVPWVGRIRHGRFTFAGAEFQLAVNHHDGDGPERGHAIHGLGFAVPWRVDDADDSSCVCSLALDWVFGGRARQTVAVSDDRLVVTVALTSTGAAFPAEIGWHPWFRKPGRLEFSPTKMYRRDRFGLPTGELVEPTTSPWDDCFVNDEPIVLRDDRPTVPAVTVASDCDHVVVYDHPADATCVEPQSGPPDAFNLAPHIVSPDTPLTRTMTISWSSPRPVTGW